MSSLTIADSWARLVDGNTVLLRNKGQSQDVVAWDVANKCVKYRLAQSSFFSAYPVLSGGRQQLFLPEDDGVRILESASGKQLSSVQTDDPASGLAVSDDGRALAVIGRCGLTVVDLTDAKSEPRHFHAEAIASPFPATLAWLGPDRVLSGKHDASEVTLFSMPHDLAVWRYHFHLEAAMHGNPGRTREFVREHLVYAAQVSQGGENGLAFGAVRMPGPKVDETVASLDIKSLMIIKPGAAIRLDVQAGNDAARVQAALERKITENQWKLDPNATTVLIAEMKRGEPTKINYRSMDVGRNQREESVTITPELSTVRIEMSGKTVWQSATSSGPPAIISLREGQTIQGEAARWQHPNPEFFDTVKIPSSIMDPAKKNGLGSTSVTNRGLVTQ